MKRVPAFLLLLVLSFAWLKPASAQIFMGQDSAAQAHKAAKREQKAQKKAAKKQRKAANKYAKAQKKAAKRAQHRS